MRFLLFAALAALCLTAEPQRIVLLQELVRLEAMEHKTLLVFPLEQQGAQVEMKFTSQRGGEGVRMAVFQRGSTQALAATSYELNGALRASLARENEYRVEIENLRQRLGHALIDVEVALVFGGRPAAPPPSAARALDPQRRLYTILASLTLFAMMCGYSAVRLTPTLRARWRGER